MNKECVQKAHALENFENFLLKSQPTTSHNHSFGTSQRVNESTTIRRPKRNSAGSQFFFDGKIRPKLVQPIHIIKRKTVNVMFVYLLFDFLMSFQCTSFQREL